MNSKDCEKFIPKGLISAIIVVMTFQSVMVAVIMLWMASRWGVSPRDAQSTTQLETNEIDAKLIYISDKLDSFLEQHSGDK